jgi:hypothetical protein
MSHLTDTADLLALHVYCPNGISSCRMYDQWLPRLWAGQLDVGELDDA